MNEEILIPRRKGYDLLGELYDLVESGVLAILAVVLVFTFVARTVGVVGESMYPTLYDADRLIATTLYSELKTGDIVVVTKPNEKNEPLIKRVIATGGQSIDIDPDTGFVYVDGKKLEEEYISEPIQPGSHIETELPRVVPRGCLFLMGDNRNNSWDSRTNAIGMVDERYVLGKVIYRIQPYDRFGKP